MMSLIVTIKTWLQEDGQNMSVLDTGFLSAKGKGKMLIASIHNF